MDFDKELKKELLESVIEKLKEKIKTISKDAQLTEIEKIQIAYKELADPYGLVINDNEEIKTRKDLEEQVKATVDNLYNYRINCGGYALKIDTCIFSSSMPEENEKQTLERNVTKILEIFPFVRLLGDAKLQEDEYLVEYRAGIGQGHHFIRIEQNGEISDKNSSKPIRNLKNIMGNEDEIWGELKDCPRAIFAVKKDHDIHTENSYLLHNGQNFEETVINYLNNGINKFEYHSHKYEITENENGDKVIVSRGEKVADIIADESGIIVVEVEEKRAYISNTDSEIYDRYLKQIVSKEPKTEVSYPVDDLELEL